MSAMELSPAAIAYDREVVPWLFDPWVKTFIDLAAPAKTAGILDLACGSGLIARNVVERLGEDGWICGVDADAAMLGYAATTSDDPRISWHESDAVQALLGDSVRHTMSVVCSLGDPEDLVGVLHSAGLADVTADVHVRTASHPEAARAVSGQLLAMSLHLLQTFNLDESQLAEVAAKMCELLADHTGPAGDLLLTSTCALAAGTNP